MATVPSAPLNVEPSCAICGAPATPECPHEGERLEVALTQALARWSGVAAIRQWVLNHARNQVLLTFERLKRQRAAAHAAYLRTLPCWTLYHQYRGNPPMHPAQLAQLHAQIAHAESVFRQGVDEDWRRSCMRYPEVLDYYFSLVEITFPDEKDDMVRSPQFGVPFVHERAKVKGWRESVGSGKEKRRTRRGSRGRTPPPAAPMLRNYR